MFEDVFFFCETSFLPPTDTRSSSITMKWNESEDPRQNVSLWSALFFAKSKSKDSYTLVENEGEAETPFHWRLKRPEQKLTLAKKKHAFHTVSGMKKKCLKMFNLLRY